MLEPLSKKKRFSYLAICAVLFVVMTPILIFYAAGYRLTDALKLTHTGGLYITTGQSATRVYINGTLDKETKLFQKNVLIQNLKPGTYKVVTSKDGLISWKKDLIVYPETVTEAHTFMLPTNPKLEKAPKSIASLFATTSDSKVIGKLLLKKVGGKLHAIWQGESEEQPSYFCQDIICVKEIIIRSPSEIKSFDFYPGRSDLVVISATSGIYVVEVDNRSNQNLQPILEEVGLDMRVDSSTIYIKKEGILYSVVL